MRYQVVCSVQAIACLSPFIKTHGQPHCISGSELECASSTPTLKRYVYGYTYICMYVYVLMYVCMC